MVFLRRRIITMFFMIGCIAIVTLAVALIPYMHWATIHTDAELPAPLVSRLQSLGKESLLSNDVPVAAVLMYGDSVIGDGFNTVLRDANAGGHAEINSISNAIRRIGSSTFSQLNRDSLVMVSTFEPCTMCMGAILEYRIKRVRFLKPKPFFFLLQEELRSIKYRWRWQSAGSEAVQDSLFYAHPGYRPNR